METKDILTLVISFFALIISAFSFFKNFDLEKRLFIEPYFIKTWKATIAQRNSQMINVNSWLSQPTQNPAGFVQRLDIEDFYLLDKLSARYANKLASSLRVSKEHILDANREIRSFNNLKDPGTTSFLMTINLGLDDDDREERWQNMVSLSHKYCTFLRNTTLHDLLNNERYQSDLKCILVKIENIKSVLDAEHRLVMEQVQIFDAKFEKLSA